MPRLRSMSGHRKCRLGCPVYGGSVVVRATYHHTDLQDPALVDFECNRDGICGISAWDPCPLYVRLMGTHPAVDIAELSALTD